MTSTTKNFKSAAKTVIKDTEVQSHLKGLYSGFNMARIHEAEATPNWEDLQNRAQAIKFHTIENLDYYLDMAATNVEKAGGQVYFAKDAAAASEYVLKVAKENGVRTVIKGKSMISEEMELNQQLAEKEIEAIEPDLGEYLIQLAGQTPYHIIVPAIHMSRGEVAEILSDNLGTPKDATIEEMAGAARDELRDKFVQADMGITGANFLVAETGTLTLVTNEGNGRMSTSMPKTHIAIMGMEKIVPSMEDMGIFLRLLIRSATGQRISSYVTQVTGPRTSEEEDGPDEFHLVIVDNGRTKMLADPNLREALNCIRCGACLNACPVYRKVGGHSYGWVYSGPIGAIVSPVLTNVPDAKDLPYASSLCGACKEACPVKINIPRMLLYLRNELTEGNYDPTRKKSSIGEFIAFKGWGLIVKDPVFMRIANWLGRLGQWPLVRAGQLRNLPPPLSAWTRYRTFPRLVKPFRDRWKSNEQ